MSYVAHPEDEIGDDLEKKLKLPLKEILNLLRFQVFLFERSVEMQIGHQPDGPLVKRQMTRAHLQNLPPRIHSCAASDIIALKKKFIIFRFQTIPRDQTHPCQSS